MFATQPIAQVGEVDEVAKLILYLVANATCSTATEFIVDGGAIIAQVLQT